MYRSNFIQGVKPALLALTLAMSALPAFANDKLAEAVADFRSCAKPVWPAESLKNGNQGTVTLEFTVSEAGKATASRVTRSSGFPLLDEAAREGLTKCSFKAATKNGQPVSSTLHIQYVWTLK